MKKNFFEVGSWNIICDSCGKKMKASHAKHRWDGFIVCNSCFEHRHPQDLIKTKPDKQTVPFSRPRGQDVFVTVTYINSGIACTPMSQYAISGYAVSGCAIAGKLLPGLLP